MRIAFTTTFNAEDVHNWSGTPYHMSHALSQNGVAVDYIGTLKRKLSPFFKMKQTFKKYICDSRESPRFNTIAAKYYSEQVASKLKNLNVDAIISPLINPIAYLECRQPIILWTDAVYAALLGFYPPFAWHSASTIHQGNEMTAACLARCKYAVFSSDWAAHSAIELYGTSRDKVKVIPFGANLDVAPSREDVQTAINLRSTNKIKLLFLAKSWERKGGDIVLAVTKALHDAGHAIELHIVGYTPPVPVEPYVICHGFISKHNPAGKIKLRQLLAESHFLFVPSRAEAYGIVFCEANAFGVPCLTTHVGGISTIIKDNINGMTFGLDTAISNYCHYIIDIMHDRKRYIALANSAYNEFTTRLNWGASAEQIKSLLQE